MGKHIKFYQQYHIFPNGKYERMRNGKYIVTMPYTKNGVKARIKYDLSSIFVPYWLHVWLEEKFFFPRANKLRAKYGENGWFKWQSKIGDFFYGLVIGFPLCCVIYFSLRENWGRHWDWEDHYLLCRRCIGKRLKEGADITYYP